ncbi:hypothetical protein WR25_09086 [Diploscapter pachys]|uniref:tRNA-uridine aminocarboxypropyltransferase 1 n=1 Tax=Diploscapter pachys TaxID=2018661 RepID=A0A2A2JN21_9BILA|nr:hypothetical protein WR25_09086 [Diploscapter pachys]
MIRKEDLKLSSYEHIKGLQKQICDRCKKSRMYYCYDCRIPLPGVFTPNVKLPCDIDVVKHKGERDSKSTALHCKIAAPEQTRVFDCHPYRNGSEVVQEYSEDDEEGATVLVYPSPNAMSIEEFVKSRGKIKRFVVLDCTWNQVHGMKMLPQIKDLPCVMLKKYRTAYWRPQYKKDDSCLATIEAIYYALREYQQYGLDKEYNGEYDDLFYWFFIGYDRFMENRETHGKRQLENENKEGENEDEQEEAAKRSKTSE